MWVLRCLTRWELHVKLFPHTGQSWCLPNREWIGVVSRRFVKLLTWEIFVPNLLSLSLPGSSSKTISQSGVWWISGSPTTDLCRSSKLRSSCSRNSSSSSLLSPKRGWEEKKGNYRGHVAFCTMGWFLNRILDGLRLCRKQPILHHYRG